LEEANLYARNYSQFVSIAYAGSYLYGGPNFRKVLFETFPVKSAESTYAVLSTVTPLSAI
jgi:hypothetical protein